MAQLTKTLLVQESLHLALSKQTIAQRVYFLLKALIFLPVIFRRLSLSSQNLQSSTPMDSQTGDDIYPLF